MYTEQPTGKQIQFLQTVVPKQNKMIRLVLDSSGLIESYTELNDATAVNIPANIADYQHVSLVKDAAGDVTIQVLPYKPSPYPSKRTVADIYHHPDGKLWAIIEEFGKPIETYFCNPQTNMIWVRQVVDRSKSLAQRTKEKEANGYKFNRTSEFNHLTRTFEF
jgi:hypothetical protein